MAPIGYLGYYSRIGKAFILFSDFIITIILEHCQQSIPISYTSYYSKNKKKQTSSIYVEISKTNLCISQILH